MPPLRELVQLINEHSQARPFGTLQSRRKRIHGLSRMPSRKPFGAVDNESYAFHEGGRTELQFNVGLEEGLPDGDLRYGVAFSFETSQTLQRIDDLLPKARRFNDYFREHSEKLSGFSMWHFDNGRDEDTRHGPYAPRLISPELFRRGVFVFLGRIGDSNHPDYEAILDTFDALLPLWEFVEARNGELPPAPQSRRLATDVLQPGKRPLAIGQHSHSISTFTTM